MKIFSENFEKQLVKKLMEYQFPITYENHLFLCRVEVRQRALRLAKLWIRNKCTCEVKHDIFIEQEIWIDLVKMYENLIMRNSPELRDVPINDNYTII